MYNLTNLTSSTYVSDVFLFSNQVSNGVVSQMFVIALFFIVLSFLITRGFDVAIFIAGWTSFIVSLFLVYMDALNVIYALAFIAITSFSALLLYLLKPRQ